MLYLASLESHHVQGYMLITVLILGGIVGYLLRTTILSPRQMMAMPHDNAPLFTVDFKLYAYRQFFKSCPVPAFILDENGNIITANQGAAEMFGGAAEIDVQGCCITNFFPDWPDNTDGDAPGSPIMLDLTPREGEREVGTKVLVRDVSCFSATGSEFTAMAGMVVD